MLEDMKEMMKGIIADDEFFDLMAQGMKKAHDALVRAGFTVQQATAIVAQQGIGFKGNS
jgi:hypothetical protein